MHAQVYQLPEPCSKEFLAAVTQWQFTEEAEDEEAKRREFYGLGGGTTFGEVCRTGCVCVCWLRSGLVVFWSVCYAAMQYLSRIFYLHAHAASSICLLCKLR
jgi:hypothetical protein